MKIISIVLSLALCLLILAGCGNSEAPNANEIANTIKTYSAETVNWTSLDKTSFEPYFGITGNGVSQFCGFINNSEEKFDMIAVFTYDNDETRQTILDGIYSLSRQMSDNYRIANANEATKITEPLIAELDNTIIVCIMDTPSKALNYIESELKATIIS